MSGHHDRLIRATPSLVDLQRGRCFWCSGLIAVPQHLGHLTFVFQTHFSFGVLESGRVYEYGIASLDHVIPRWMGGDKRDGNIVAACVQCNQDRGLIHQRDTVDPTGLDDWIWRNRGWNIVRRERRFGTNLGELLAKAISVDAQSPSNE